MPTLNTISYYIYVGNIYDIGQMSLGELKIAKDTLEATILSINFAVKFYLQISPQNFVYKFPIN